MDNHFKIYLDTIVFRIQKFGGASTYWKELSNNFMPLNNVNFIVQSNDINELNNDGQTIAKLGLNEKISIVEDTLPASILRYLPFTKRLPAKSLYHSSYYRTCLQRNVANIFTVHDFTHKKGYASKFPRKLVHIGLTSIGLKNADGIICISENTKRDLMHYYPSIPESRIKVIYHGVSEDFFPVGKGDLTNFNGIVSPKDNFVLFVGKRSGYKKFDIVAQALKEVKDIKLLIIGGGDLSSLEKEYLENNLNGRYFKIDGIGNKELNILYNNAYALLYPSLYEGFGFPVIEAMRAGCPVITTNLSSIPEVAGEAGVIIEELTANAILEKINSLRNSKFRDEIIKKGFSQSEKFSWKQCSSETLKFYEDVWKLKFDNYKN